MKIIEMLSRIFLCELYPCIYTVLNCPKVLQILKLVSMPDKR